MKVLKFHQFVHVEKGPVNSMIIDFLQEHVFHVSTEYVEYFAKREYNRILDLIQILKKDKLIIEIDENRWIPASTFKHAEDDKKENRSGIDIYTLEIGGNIDLDRLAADLSGFRISRIFYYGDEPPGHYFPGTPREKKVFDFNGCQLLSCINEEFQAVDELEYEYNMQFNSCWGGKVAVCDDMTVRPCIYSKIVVGHISEFKTPADLKNKMNRYWTYTKDNVVRCKDCELRYVCYDCREIPYRKSGRLDAENPNCSYNPRTGKW